MMSCFQRSLFLHMEFGFLASRSYKPNLRTILVEVKVEENLTGIPRNSNYNVVIIGSKTQNQMKIFAPCALPINMIQKIRFCVELLSETFRQHLNRTDHLLAVDCELLIINGPKSCNRMRLLIWSYFYDVDLVSQSFLIKITVKLRPGSRLLVNVRGSLFFSDF